MTANRADKEELDGTKIYWYDPTHQFLVGELPDREDPRIKHGEDILMLAYGPLGHAVGIRELPYKSVMDRPERIKEATAQQLYELPKESDLAQLIQRRNKSMLLA